MMEKTPKSLRLHIGLFGRMNVGKSSFLNYIAGQDVAITSAVPGTTTDVVEKTMELLPLGAVVFLDTAGLDDVSELAGPRTARALKALDAAEVVVLLTEPGIWGSYEEDIVRQAANRHLPLISVVNKIDTRQPSADFLRQVQESSRGVLVCSCLDRSGRDQTVNAFKSALIEVCPDDFLNPPPLVSDLVSAGGLAVLIVPIDLEAPKGRLILPQVQTLREILDSDAAAMVVKEREYAHFLSRLTRLPDLVICDSQVVLKMVADTPPEVPCTTFSILFSRNKGDLREAVAGARALETLQSGDKILIAESCSHHAIEDDIGRVKLPRWIQQFTGGRVAIDICAGKDYPQNLGEYKLVVHCGGCMMTRRQVLARLTKARQAGVPVTNYGVCISYLHGVLDRVLSPFAAMGPA